MKNQKSIHQEPIRVAIAGLGFGEAVHLPALNANPDLKAVSLWHPNNERLKDAATKNHIGVHKNWEDLLNDSNVEAIILATPPEPRLKLACEALRAGKHLLLEKPVALNALEVAEIQKLAMQKKLSVAVDYEYRAVPLFMQAKRIISQGAIGDPWLMKLDWLMSSRANQSRPWNWYSESEKGGGVLGALGTHAFDMIHWLIGPTENVNALLSTSIKERIDIDTGKERTVTSEDVVLAQLLINGAENNFSIPGQISLSAVTRQGRGFWLELYGSNGTLILGSDNQKDYVHGFGLWLTKAGEKTKVIIPDSDLTFPTTWTDGRIAPVARLQSWWAESIKTGQPMIPGLSEGLASQKVCDRVRESAETGQRLPL